MEKEKIQVMKIQITNTSALRKSNISLTDTK